MNGFIGRMVFGFRRGQMYRLQSIEGGLVAFYRGWGESEELRSNSACRAMSVMRQRLRWVGRRAPRGRAV
ncbi:hypothetical protein MA16_Dca023790 [Dendrobium catenatum]|uniref:Uncharacterized protein n=1 Tax=Dendrobium catenatum TaxID=906689 RepID=A0A2I0XFA8_9ASPA|nr:hypothetical protein MA16_Dca023790 [Dendrobium catenatum]